MPDIDQIQAAHAKVKSGADFPAYVQDLIQLGVQSYTTFVKDGHTEYRGFDEAQIETSTKHNPLEIAEAADEKAFRHNLKIHQEGKTDYPTFCGHAAEAGIGKWRVDTTALTCSYYDRSGVPVLIEEIPQPE